ncbi:hypothetical protein LCGC14_2322300, partial [marine sediment metagenome]
MWPGVTGQRKLASPYRAREYVFILPLAVDLYG